MISFLVINNAVMGTLTSIFATAFVGFILNLDRFSEVILKAEMDFGNKAKAIAGKFSLNLLLNVRRPPKIKTTTTMQPKTNTK